MTQLSVRRKVSTKCAKSCYDLLARHERLHPLFEWSVCEAATSIGKLRTAENCSLFDCESRVICRCNEKHFPERTLTKQQLFLDQFVSLPFDDQAANTYCRLRADLESKGQPIGPLDMLIAAIALANNLALVTNNTREFSRIVGLQLEDWEI